LKLLSALVDQVKSQNAYGDSDTVVWKLGVRRLYKRARSAFCGARSPSGRTIESRRSETVRVLSGIRDPKVLPRALYT
jgi:hypothetical protein